MARREEFPVVFARLKMLLQVLVPPLLVEADTEDNYYLKTLPLRDRPDGLFFGAVQIKKNYVSYHLMPVYIYPDLLSGLSAPLLKRMQGKSCFNFTSVDETLVEELQKLTMASFARGRQAFQTAEEHNSGDF